MVLILLVFLAAAWFGRWWAAPAKAETAEATDAADVADDAEKVEDSYNFDPKQSGRANKILVFARPVESKQRVPQMLERCCQTVLLATPAGKLC